MTEAKKKPVSGTIRGELVDRLYKEATDRMIGVSLLLEKAVEEYLDRLPPIALPAPPTPAIDAEAGLKESGK